MDPPPLESGAKCRVESRMVTWGGAEKSGKFNAMTLDKSRVGLNPLRVYRYYFERKLRTIIILKEKIWKINLNLPLADCKFLVREIGPQNPSQKKRNDVAMMMRMGCVHQGL